jgi:predicted 3-demethylubiquinone-9 3-methyltransferase (glyoxalase superfamily)
MNKITTNLWFDTQAEEAAEFYIAAFGDGSVGSKLHYTEAGQEVHGRTPGTVMTVDFRVLDHDFVGLNGGPAFTFNPSVSFIVNYDPSRDENAQANLDKAWNALADGGTPLMPLQEYPFSKHYGWIQDKFGVSWQLMLTDPSGEPRPVITPSIMFVGDNCGKAEEAQEFYLSVFKNAKKGNIMRYPAGMEPEKEGTVMFSDFMLEGQWFAAMDSAQEHKFQLNEAFSFVVNCADQAEVDYYWEKLSAVPESEQCGWLKDKYGVSWQIVPTEFLQILTNSASDTEKFGRVMGAMMKMKKLDLGELKAAADES